MNARTQVEVVMECNIRARAHVNHAVWAPCATSTPVRKPLIMLNKAEVIGSRQCDVKKRKTACGVLAIEGSERKHSMENISKNRVRKKLNKIGRRLHYLEENDDESEDEKEDSQSNKLLVIKLGSSQVSKRSIRNKIDMTRATAGSNKQGKHGILYDSVKPNTGENEMEKSDGKKPAMSVEQVHSMEDPGNELKVEITNLKELDFNNIEVVKSDNCRIKLPSMQNTVSSSNGVNLISDSAQQKRKNKSPKTNVKRLKSESNCHIPSLGKGNNKKVRTIRNSSTSCKKIGGTIDRIKRDNISRLSVSHEIFSDSKEKELMDSLKLTADDDELSISDSNQNQPLTMQKNFSKQKTESDCRERFHSCDNSQLSRPKRERKSPKEFWLPKTEPSQGNNDHNNGEIAIIRETNQEKTITKEKDMASSVTTSCKAGDSDLPAESAYIKTITEMEFEENCATDETKKFSVALGWQFSSFKCCALKIGAKCEASGRTKFNNSHFGGVLLKGRLSMKIGETEVKMKEGQMFHVPPLTDWKAFNIGRNDCILYYWVGKL